MKCHLFVFDKWNITQLRTGHGIGLGNGDTASFYVHKQQRPVNNGANDGQGEIGAIVAHLIRECAHHFADVDEEKARDGT